MSNRRTRRPVKQVRTSRRWRNARLALWAVVICVGVAMLIARTGKWGQVHFSAAPTGGTASQEKNGPVPFSPPAAPPPASDPLIDDDGRTLWVSPTDGPPLDLSYLPPGAQIIVALWPEALAAYPEGDKVFDALGPLGFRGAQFLEDVLLQPHGVERAVIGCHATSDGNWETMLVVRLSGRTAAEHLAAKLPNAIERSHDGETYWLADGRAYYLPAGDDDMLLVVAPEESIVDIINLAGDVPPLRRDVERLLAHTDADRHVTVVFAPNFLFGDGGSMFSGEMARLREPLFWFLGDELSAAALSMHWGDDFFVELLATPTLDTSPERAARILAERLAEVPDRLEDYVLGLDASPYARQVVAGFPGMVRQLAAYTRTSYESGHVVLRCYLPAVAGHNLLMGAELTLAESQKRGEVHFSSTSSGEAAVEAKNGPVPFFARERLRRVTSLRFARDTLEAALEQLAQDIGVEIVIRGADLQTEGITKNQSFGVEMENRPAEEVLVEILRLANPDKTATGPSDPRQKLVYVIGPSDSGDSQQIIVTTRGRAAERGDELPPVFQP